MRLLLVVVAVLAIAPAASAKTVRGGTVEIGVGAAGIELGMTRAEVKEALGKPRDQNPRFMAFGPRNAARGAFDVYLETTDEARVRMLGLWGKRFELPDGTRIFNRRGVVEQLKDEHGKRLKRKHAKRYDTRLYRIKTRHRGRRVWTDFQVDRFGPKARITSMFILYPG